jgi:putative ABC transport system permease protein
MSDKAAQLWLPWQISNEMRQRHGRFARAIARLKPGVTLAQAQSEMDTIGARLAKQYPDFNTNWGVNLVALRTQFSGEIRKALLILLGAVGFVLLIACANVANLLLARGVSRQKEIAVRAALGAGRTRIIRQLLTESLLLAGLGGVLGLMLAWEGTAALVALSPPELLDAASVAINGPVLGFTFGVSLLTGIIFGLVPAFEAAEGGWQEHRRRHAQSSPPQRFRCGPSRVGARAAGGRGAANKKL